MSEITDKLGILIDKWQEDAPTCESTEGYDVYQSCIEDVLAIIRNHRPDPTLNTEPPEDDREVLVRIRWKNGKVRSVQWGIDRYRAGKWETLAAFNDTEHDYVFGVIIGWIDLPPAPEGR